MEIAQTWLGSSDVVKAFLSLITSCPFLPIVIPIAFIAPWHCTARMWVSALRCYASLAACDKDKRTQPTLSACQAACTNTAPQRECPGARRADGGTRLAARTTHAAQRGHKQPATRAGRPSCSTRSRW
jgi:hypothetical protein